MAVDHRRATAERNLGSILDAAEALLARGAAAGISAVAAEAGVSRVTVYAHFPTRETLLEAVATRAVRRAMTAIEAVTLDEGTPFEALDRLTAAGWSEIERHQAVAHAVGEQLGAAAVARAHEAMHEPLAALVRRGQNEGAFRRDLPIAWLLASFFALMHAYRDEVGGGRLRVEDAVPTLQATLRGVFQTDCSALSPSDASASASGEPGGAV
jgi:TetR/AcrR family transcriptional regulator, mexCD-oprJ operon repressor